MEENRLQVQIYQENYSPRRWVLSTQLSFDRGTLILYINHDWSEEPDTFKVELATEEENNWLEENYDEYVKECHEHGDDPPENVIRMPEWVKPIVAKLKARWEALNMLATFAVTW